MIKSFVHECIKVSVRRFRSGRAGFTLIELLVVISIIGMLSSVVLAALASAKEKGRIGGGLQFASHNYQKLGTTMVGMWNFNGDYKDSSGNGYTLSPQGNPSPVFSSDSPSGIGKSVYFDTGSSGQYHLTSGTIANGPKLIPTGSKGFTVSLWVKPTDSNDNSVLVDLYGSNRDAFVLSALSDSGANNLYVQVGAPQGNPIGSGFQNTFSGVIVLNRWQQFTITYDGTDLSLYVDGRLFSKRSYGLCYSNSFCPAYDTLSRIDIIQEDVNGDSATFLGNLDDVVIYNESLTASAVGKLYAESAPKHGIALK